VHILFVNVLESRRGRTRHQQTRRTEGPAKYPVEDQPAQTEGWIASYVSSYTARPRTLGSTDVVLTENWPWQWQNK